MEWLKYRDKYQSSRHYDIMNMRCAYFHSMVEVHLHAANLIQVIVHSNINFSICISMALLKHTYIIPIIIMVL